MEKPAVLLIHTGHGSSQDESITLSRQVIEILNEREPDIPVFATVLQVSEEDIKNAEHDGVELILPRLNPDDPRTDTSPDWLTFDHRSKYPHLPPVVRSIVGHSDVTSKAAVRIKQERYHDAKGILITTDIPEDTEYYKGDEKAMGIGKKEDSILEDAREADVVFSLGNKIFDHFENQFRAIPPNKRPQHFKFVPRPSKIYEDAEAEYKNTETMIVLSIGGVKGVEKLKGYDLAIEALSIVADKMKVKYRIIGVDEDDFETRKAILEHCKSANLQITLLPYGTQKDICKEMMQAHLVLMPSRAEPFGLVGLEAIAAGVPVLVSSKSGLADFIHEHVDELHHSIVDMDESDEGAIARHMANSIERMLKHNRTEFEAAARCKHKLLSTKYWEESNRQFIKACTDEGDSTQNPDQVQKRKTGADSAGEAGEGGKALKLDQKVKMSIRTPDSSILRGNEILLEKLKHMIAKDVQSDVIFNERMEMYRQLESEVQNAIDDTVSEKGKDTILHFINELFTRAVLRDHARFRAAMNRLSILKAEIRKLCEGCVLCELRFDQRDSQVEFVTACRDGSLSAILTEEYISQELVKICGGMPLYVHIEVDEVDFQKGSRLSHEGKPPDGHDHSPSLSAAIQTAALTVDLQKMELQDVPIVTPSPEPADSDYQETAETLDETGMQQVTSELVSLDIRELEQLMEQPRKRTSAVGSESSGYRSDTLGSGTKRLDSSPTDDERDTQNTLLETLLAKLNTQVVMQNKEQQCVLSFLIGDLHRTKLHNLKSALQYYQNMVECSQAISDDTMQAVAYSRLGLTYDMLGLQEEAHEKHEMALSAVCRVESGKGDDVTVAYKNLASSMALSGQVSKAKANYESALAVAMERGNKTEQMDIYCLLGDLHKDKLDEPQVSQNYYTEMLAIARDMGRKDKEGVAINRLGLAYELMKDYEKSLELFQKVLKIKQDEGDMDWQATAHRNLGNTYRLLGREDQATSHFNTALQMAEQTRNQHEKIRVYFCMGEMHREQLRSPRTSIQYYEQYLALARHLRERQEMGLAYNRLGVVNSEIGDYEAALEWHQKCLKMSQEDGDENSQIEVLITMSNTYLLHGNLNKATSHFNTALEMAQQTGNKYGQMWVNYNLGVMHMEHHSEGVSIQYYEQALNLARQTANRDMEKLAVGKLGLAHFEIGEYEAASGCYEKYLKMSQEDGDEKVQITAHIHVGDTYRKSGKLDLAASHLNTALQMAQQAGYQYEQMKAYCYTGEMYREQLHSPHTAIQYYEQAMTIAKLLKDRQGEGVSCIGMGLAHFEMGEFDEALAWLLRKVKEDDGDKKGQTTAHKYVGDTYRKLGKLDQATSHFNTALQMAQQTGDKQEQMNLHSRIGDMNMVELCSSRTAIQHYKHCVTLARQLSNRYEEGMAYQGLGMVNYDIGEYVAASEYFQKYLEIEEDDEDKNAQRTHLKSDNTSIFRNLQSKAATSCMDNSNISKQGRNRHLKMTVYALMGKMHREQLNTPRKAIQDYEQYLALARQLGERHEEGEAYINLGSVHFEIGEYEAGLEWYQKYLGIKEENDEDRKKQIAVHIKVGITCSLLSKLDQATSHFNVALQKAQQTGDRQRQMEVNFSMGEIHREQLHSPRTAIQYYEQHLALARQLGDRHEEGLAYNRLGRVYFELKKCKTALEWYQKCLTMKQDDGDKSAQIKAHKNIALSYKKIGEKDLARSHYQSALTIATETDNRQEQRIITKNIDRL